MRVRCVRWWIFVLLFRYRKICHGLDVVFFISKILQLLLGENSFSFAQAGSSFFFRERTCLFLEDPVDTMLNVRLNDTKRIADEETLSAKTWNNAGSRLLKNSIGDFSPRESLCGIVVLDLPCRSRNSFRAPFFCAGEWHHSRERRDLSTRWIKKIPCHDLGHRCVPTARFELFEWAKEGKGKGILYDWEESSSSINNLANTSNQFTREARAAWYKNKRKQS